MRTIVVPLDGSTFAERALRPAFAFAARLGSTRVVLVTCAREDGDAARRRLDDRAALFAGVVPVDARLVDSEHTAATILSIVDAEPEATLCMATRGRGGLGSALLGSVAKHVVGASMRPLVLVGPNCRTALLPGERGRLVVASDGSEFAETIVPTAASWCDRLGLEPWITEVVGPDENPEPVDRPVPNREVEAAAARLDVLANRFDLPPGTVGVEVLPGAPGRSIPWFAERLPAALIAMATHGRTGLTHLTLGSVATEVVRHAPCPVLVSRPPDDRPGDGISLSSKEQRDE